MAPGLQEMGPVGPGGVRTEHIWSDKRKFQLIADRTKLTAGLTNCPADCTNSEQIGPTVHQIGQTVLKIGQNIAQSIRLPILMGNFPTL